MLETSRPPVYYIPPEDVRREHLRLSRRHTYCEFKGDAGYYDLVVAGLVMRDAARCYPTPSPGYEALRGHLAFYPSRVDEAHVGDDLVEAQDGDFYGGWVTADVSGPFKGGPGTAGW